MSPAEKWWPLDLYPIAKWAIFVTIFKIIFLQINERERGSNYAGYFPPLALLPLFQEGLAYTSASSALLMLQNCTERLVYCATTRIITAHRNHERVRISEIMKLILNWRRLVQCWSLARYSSNHSKFEGEKKRSEPPSQASGKLFSNCGALSVEIGNKK